MARTTGALNIRTQQVMDSIHTKCAERGLDLIDVGLDLIQSGKLRGERKRLPPADRLMVWREMMQYAFSKQGQVKHTLELTEDNALSITWDLFDEPKEIEGEVVN